MLHTLFHARLNPGISYALCRLFFGLSMRNLTYTLLVLVFFVLPNPSISQGVEDTMSVVLDEISITATRIPTAARELTKQIEVLPRSLMELMPSATIDELLRLSAAIDIRRRGPFGAQADLGMRGAGFGQNLVMVDGIRVNDPQSGHHSLVMPFRAEDIERVEILPGHMSGLHGADAFGGLVNIVTRTTTPNTAALRLTTGMHGLVDAAAHWSVHKHRANMRNSVGHIRHDGYSDGTDLRMSTVTHRSNFRVGTGDVSVLAAYLDKEFGAFDFYSPGRGIPSREHIRSVLATAQTRQAVKSAVFRGGASWRRLHDTFVFDSRIPDQYVNTHVTDMFTMDAAVFADLFSTIQSSAGVQLYSDRISSSALGEHRRHAAAVFASGRHRIASALITTADLRLDVHSDTPPQFNPSIGVAFLPARTATMHVSVGRSFRMPSYTDLYYRDPVNSGSPDLVPEHAWSTEVGGRFSLSDKLRLSATVFHRRQYALIDYVLDAASDRYIARNIHDAFAQGLNAGVEFAGDAQRIATSLQYQYLFSKLDDAGPLVTRYALMHPRHKLTALLALPLGEFVRTQVAAVYARPFEHGSQYATLDVRVRWQAGGRFVIGASAENVFNHGYEEIPGIPMPGRWLTMSAEMLLW